MTMRGIGVEPRYFYPDGSIQELESWGVNLVRLHIIENSKWAGHTVFEGVSHALRIVSQMEGTGIKCVFNIRLECQCDYEGHMRWWELLIPHIDRMDCVLGYDIVNEPWDADRSMKNWVDGLPRYIDRLRQLTSKVLIVQPGYWGTDSGFRLLKPLGPDVWYGCNFWSPQSFTHQGVGNYPIGVTCPDNLREVILSKKRRLFDWHEKYPDAQIFIPEFGVSKWATEEDANRYIEVCTGLFEEIGASACWHHYPGRIFTPREGLKKWWRLNDEVLDS